MWYLVGLRQELVVRASSSAEQVQQELLSIARHQAVYMPAAGERGKGVWHGWAGHWWVEQWEAGRSDTGPSPAVYDITHTVSEGKA